MLLALPSAAFALGLGDIRLLSSLNAPLNAEIEVTDVAPDEVNTVQAQLASRDVFARNGLDYPAYLSTVQLRAVRTPDGREVIRLKSNDPIADPFVTLLVEVNWSHGQLVREYTLLLDPPIYTPGEKAGNAPVNAATSGAGAHEGAIARGAENPPAAAPAPAVTPSTPAATSAAAAPSAAPAPSAAAPAPREAAAPAAAPGAGSTRTVKPGETLSAIAGQVAGTAPFSLGARSWMLAIYQANPRAFERNMNVMRAGSVLRIPEAAQAAAISPAEATAEIRRQYAAWHGTAGTASAGAATGAQPGRLHLVTPTESASAGTTAGAAAGAEVGRLEKQVKDLEGQLAESKRLLDLKNADLERLQAQLAARQGEKPAAAAPPPAPTAAPTPAAQPPVAQVPPPPPAAAPVPAEQPPVAAAPPPNMPLAEKPAPVKKPAPAAPAPEGPSLIDTLMGYWWALALIVVAVIAVAVLRVVRSRRESEFDDSLGRLAVAGAGGTGGMLGGGAMPRGLAGTEPPIRAAPEPEEPAVVVEETGTHERPRFAAAPAAKHVTAEDTLSSETAINLDQGDPLAEADFHMAYGLYDQAADLIRIAIMREPARRDLKLKLLEVFFVWGNKEQFLQMAHELAGSRADAAPGEWEKILIMGKQLAPEDSLFTGGGAVSGATAGGVDLNLEGGQSRVDFDLLGEPVPADMPQGVDLDIGAAVGESEATAEMTSGATTNVTDQHTQLLESTIPEGTVQTGITRQMTAKMRQPGAAVSDVEGPTVEQPALAQEGSPTIRKKVESALRQSGAEQTAELALDDLGLDVGSVDTVDQPALGMPAPGEGPTLVANLDEHTRRNLEDTARQAAATSTTGQWSFDQEELESALAKGGAGEATSRFAALKEHGVDVELGSTESTGTHERPAELDIDVGSATGTHPAAGAGLDLDVGTATVPDTAFAATQRLASEDLALPDLEPVTMSEVGTKLDLARAYMDMGDPDGARNILEEVLSEGSAAQKQEAQRLMESLPG
ncbi:MAG TPA: FimV/HubP family polar landmark protein [Steroidobacteraceae bacterium]|nr:FimV/HubP family polar landmark protein [Steroidobacteraceae bacterium]